jgi:MraZ protein
MIIGQYLTRLSEKNRTSLPKKFRDAIGDEGIIARWYEGCLVVVNGTTWKALLNRLTAKANVITQPVRDTDRFILGSAFEIEFDDQGRFVIPKVLKDYARLEDEVYFIGLGDRVEVWNKKDWEDREAYIAKNAAQLVEKLSQEVAGKEKLPDED